MLCKAYGFGSSRYSTQLMGATEAFVSPGVPCSGPSPLRRVFALPQPLRGGGKRYGLWERDKSAWPVRVRTKQGGGQPVVSERAQAAQRGVSTEPQWWLMLLKGYLSFEKRVVDPCLYRKTSHTWGYSCEYKPDFHTWFHKFQPLSKNYLGEKMTCFMLIVLGTFHKNIFNLEWI